MRILVTGAAGFIGSNLCKRLLDLGHKVEAWDNFMTGQEENLDRLYKHLNFRFNNVDITDFEKVKKFFDSYDVVFNLACPASPIHYQNDAIETWKTNVFGVYNLLCVMEWNNCDAVFVQASTSEIYGDPLEHPQIETYQGNVNTLGPRACYDEGKRAAETIIYDFYRKYKTKVRVARIFNTYGENMAVDDGRVVSNFIIQAIQDDPITIYGNGSQTRSLCYITDMVDALIKLSESDYHLPINLGNPTEMTIEELAYAIKKFSGSNSKISFEQLPQDDPKKRCPDITRAKKILKWEPKVGLEEGLKNTIEYFKQC